MTCEEFEVFGLEPERAGGAGNDAEAARRAAALEHASDCARCASLQEQWQAAQVELQALRAETREAETPSRVEMRLRMELRKRQALKMRRGAVAIAWALAAAAVLASVVSWREWRGGVAKPARSTPEQGSELARSAAQGGGPAVVRPESGTAKNGAPEVATPQSGTPENNTPQRDTPPQMDTAKDRAGETIVPETGTAKNAMAVKAAAASRSKKAVATARSAAKRDALAAQGAAEEAAEAAAAEFTLLPGSLPEDAADAAVVRVRLQRGTLVALGLPVSEERAGDWIQVDLLVGESGQPHAVRLAR